MQYLLTLCGLATVVSAYTLPTNLAAIYNNHKAPSCVNKLASGFNDGGGESPKWSYCGDLKGAIFLHSSLNGGQYNNMDIDCDGANRSGGACANDPSGQSQTSFMDLLPQYGIQDLDANIHPYVVFGNDGGSATFRPQDFGMEPLSVMAIVCNNQVIYGVWGDTNGAESTGEASLSLAKLCFPTETLSGDQGHSPKDVMFIGFTGKAAVPGSSADWTATSAAAFEASIKSLGDKLVAQLF